MPRPRLVAKQTSPLCYGRQLVVKTDSNVLKWLVQKKDVSGKFARWIIILQEYLLDIHHIGGSANVVADALSCAPVGRAEETDPTEQLLAALQPGEYSSRDIALLQHADEDIRKIVLQLQGYQASPPNDTKPFTFYKGVLYRRNDRRGRPHLLVTPSILRKDVIAECHDTPSGGHQGIEKTMARVSERYWWKGIAKSVAAYVKSCPFCQSFKARVGFPAGKLCSIPPPTQVFESIGIDHLVPFKKTKRGMTNLVVCIDYLSRWIEVSPVVDTATESVVEFLHKQIFSRHGVPVRLISDQGSGFTSRDCADFLQKWRVRQIFASGEHPETNGLVEKANGTLTSAFAAFVNFQHTDWDEKVADAAFCINTAKQSSTEISPFELIYARHAALSQDRAFPWPPADTEAYEDRLAKVVRWRKTARALVLKSQRRSKSNYDKYRKPDPIFHPGDLVLVARHRRANGRTKKLNPRFVGPYQVVKRMSPTCYLVEDLPYNRRKRVWRRFKAHSSQLRKYHSRREVDWVPLNNSSDEEDEVAELHSTALNAKGHLPGASQQAVLASASTDMSPDTGLSRPLPSVAVSTISPPDTFRPSSDVDAALIPNLEAGPTRVTVTRSNRLSRPRADRDFLYY